MGVTSSSSSRPPPSHHPILTPSEAKSLAGPRLWRRLELGFTRLVRNGDGLTCGKPSVGNPVVGSEAVRGGGAKGRSPSKAPRTPGGALAQSLETLDRETFVRRVAFGHIVPPDLCGTIFSGFDASGTGSLTSEEFCVGMAVLSRGNALQKVQMLFNIYDIHREGTVSRGKVEQFMKVVYGERWVQGGVWRREESRVFSSYPPGVLPPSYNYSSVRPGGSGGGVGYANNNAPGGYGYLKESITLEEFRRAVSWPGGKEQMGQHLQCKRGGGGTGRFTTRSCTGWC